MGFTLKVDDSIVLGYETIQNVEFSIDTPQDTNAKTTDVSVALKVTGKIRTMLDDETESTVELALWSMVPSEMAECYRTVTVLVETAGKIVREYTLPKAFVVDYKERYDDTEGVGTFELVVKQKKDKIKATSVTGGYDRY